MADEIGLPGFDQVEEIGRGAFGLVYRARQIDLERIVAIKVLTGVFDEQARGRFDRERRSMGAVSSHPNIVSVYGSGLTEQGRPYILMEYAPGGSLAEAIARQGPLPWADAAAIGAKLGDALAAAHAAGVLHRDVKPENVLLSAYGEPMLADFGIARMAGSAATRTGMVTASVAQAAPEIIEGKRPTEQSDVYSLASTVYGLIAGHAPFVKDTDESIIPVIARAATEPVPDLRPSGVPDQIASVLERGMSKDATERGTAVEFARSLREAHNAAPPGSPVPVGTMTITALPPTPVTTAPADVPTEDTPVGGPPTEPPTPPGAGGTSSSRRAKVTAALVGAAIILVGAGVAVSLGGGKSDEKSSKSSETKPKTTSTTSGAALAAKKAKSYAQRIENILEQSASGRGQVGPLVTGVLDGCSTSPSEASTGLAAVIDNRDSILSQLSSLTDPPDAAAQTYYSLLQKAIQSSIEADIQYKSWADSLASDPFACDTNPPPTNAAFDAAQAADANSTDLKMQFTDAFNPVATEFGLQTWAPGDF